ncbi:hypothetical protein OAV43_04310, partial [Pseudomonadales bacterium]|nr:hypothetical protein [Pseudomonadales bacterium]
PCRVAQTLTRSLALWFRSRRGISILRRSGFSNCGDWGVSSHSAQCGFEEPIHRPTMTQANRIEQPAWGVCAMRPLLKGVDLALRRANLEDCPQ